MGKKKLKKNSLSKVKRKERILKTKSYYLSNYWIPFISMGIGPMYGFFFKFNFNFIYGMYIYNQWCLIAHHALRLTFEENYIYLIKKYMEFELSILAKNQLFLAQQENQKLLSEFNDIKPFDWDEELVYERLIEETDFERAYALDAFIILDKQIQLYVDEYLIYTNLKRNEFQSNKHRIFSNLLQQPVENKPELKYIFSKPIILFNFYQQQIQTQLTKTIAVTKNNNLLLSQKFFSTLAFSPIADFLKYKTTFTLISTFFLAPRTNSNVKQNNNLYYWDLIYNWFTRKNRQKYSYEAIYAANRVFYPFICNKINVNLDLYEYLIMSLFMVRRKNTYKLEKPIVARRRERIEKTIFEDNFFAKIKEKKHLKHRRIILFDIMENYSHEIKARFRIFSRLRIKKIKKKKKWQIKKNVVHSLKIILKHEAKGVQEKIFKQNYPIEPFFNYNKNIEKKIKNLKLIRKKELKLYPSLYHDNWHSIPKYFFHSERFYYSRQLFYNPKTFFNNDFLEHMCSYMPTIDSNETIHAFPSLVLFSSAEDYLHEIYYKYSIEEEDDYENEEDNEDDQSDFDRIEEQETEEVIEEKLAEEEDDFQEDLADITITEENEESTTPDYECEEETDIKLQKYDLDLYITIKKYLTKKKKARNIIKIIETQ